MKTNPLDTSAGTSLVVLTMLALAFTACTAFAGGKGGQKKDDNDSDGGSEKAKPDFSSLEEIFEELGKVPQQRDPKLLKRQSIDEADLFTGYIIISEIPGFDRDPDGDGVSVDATLNVVLAEPELGSAIVGGVGVGQIYRVLDIHDTLTTLSTRFYPISRFYKVEVRPGLTGWVWAEHAEVFYPLLGIEGI